MNVMQNITKKRDLPEGLENLSKRGPKKSKYNTAEVIPYAEVNTSVAIALMKYQKIREGLIPGAIAVDTNKDILWSIIFLMTELNVLYIIQSMVLLWHLSIIQSKR